MKRKVEFKEWTSSCEKVWKSEVPRLKPRRTSTSKQLTPNADQLLLPDFNEAIKSPKSFYDELLTRVIVDYRWDSEEDITYEVFIQKDGIHPNTLVQNEFQNRLANYFGASDVWDLQAQVNCPYCKSILLNAAEDNTEDPGYGILFEACPNCNYWTWQHFAYTITSRHSLTTFAYTTYLGKVREFDCELPEGCINEIAAWIRRNPFLWHSIQPTRFEQLVADIFRANYDHATVSHVGKPDDGGVDIVYVDTQQKQWLVQIKRREKPNSTESVSTIRNLLGTLLLENASHGIVVSTADHFSYRAYAAVNRAKECGMILRLVDRHALDHMLDGVLTDKPWLPPLQKTFPEFIPYLEATIPDFKLTRRKRS